MDFDINESLKLYLSDPASIQTPEAAPEIADADTDSLDQSVIADVLEPIRDSIHDHPDALNRSTSFDTLQCLLKYVLIPTVPTRSIADLSRLAPSVPGPLIGKVLDIVTSGFSNEADLANQDVENDEQETITHHKQLLEMYGFLLQWSISAVEAKAAEKPAAPARKGAKGTKKTAAKDGTWDSTSQVQTAMDVMCRVMKLKLNRIFSTTSDRDTFINLLTRSVYLIMESEPRMKVISIRMFCFKVLCIAIKHNGHALGAQTSIIQNLTYFEHLSEPMAELLHILSEQYDYAQLSSEVLRELAAKEFSPTDAKGPKAVSLFITKLSELEPRLVGKELGQLAKFLDSEAYTLRCAIIEVCGNLLADLSKLEEQDESTKVQINAFFDVLEQRFLDTNPYCRCRAIQVFMKVCTLEQKYPKRRQNAAELAVQSLQDKSSNVRRNAVKLLGKLVSTHPFSVMHGGELSMTEWEARLEAVDEQIKVLQPAPEEAAVAKTAEGEEAVDSGLLDEATQMQGDIVELTEEQREERMQQAEKEAATQEVLAKLKLTRKYYVEALRFIEVIHEASDITCQLLSAKNKSEVIEAMDLFVVIDAYKIETARKGIRRMLRLIWTKGNSDEGKGVQTHLIDCYRGLFFDAPDSFNPNDAANFIARNMISLTFGASPAELTSLEQLLATMMTGGHVSQLVIAKLWQVYGVNKDISKAQRRGAIIVLGMIATADPTVAVKEIDTMLRVGLGPIGRKDLILARYTCVALRRMIPPAKKAQDPKKKTGIERMPNEHAVLRMLASILLLPSSSQDWYGMAEQAISAIYVLSEHPDVLCSEVLRQKTKKVFSRTQSMQSISRTPSPEPQHDVDAMDVDEPTERTGEVTMQPETQQEQQPEGDKPDKQSAAISLSQLLFTVGHIAVKQIVHLELCELDFKRRKQDLEKDKPVSNPLPEKTAPTPAARRKKAGQPAEPEKEDEKDELDMIGGTTEDDFTEAIQHIRERELLYSRQSILALYGPLVTEVCANNTLYASRHLQAQATLCLAKLMCVSSEYCERNLPLLITILERSPDPIVRSNAVIALGDMAVCFNHLIDENTDFLYRRLQDADDSVKRTCLMTLTFLILAGQVKVKGQLGEMAKCLEDSDRKISDLARMFFSELATKDNAVYNQFVDMFSILTQTGSIEGGILEEDATKRILKFLCGFIEKDKHAKNLAEKLSARLGRCENERQWNDTAFALGLLGHGKSEEIEKKVKEGYRVVDGAAA
ncbi:condensin complex non-SMC subunit Cnd1 [Knufia fluminis]|uniref:Condensin complex subunit 1 n=1 Tax=Knufia fluminis TaxID=191047 RepID=A0AAN8EWH5_9EURO|nr:condensin complex non-SMC subunit Cnd1 [Knufia fluminis]